MRRSINLHIYQSPMTHESRIFKTAKTISNNFDEILLLGIGKKGLVKKEQYAQNITIKRSSQIPIKGFTFLFYYIWVTFQLIKYRPKVLTIHSLELLPFVFLAKLTRSKIIYDAHELETEKNGMGGFRKKISVIVEKLCLKLCTKVSVVGFEIAKHYEEKYNIKPYVILNIPYLNNGETLNNNLFRKEFNLEDTDTIFLYQGLLGKGRGIENLIHAFTSLNQPSKKLIFMGYGTLEEYVKEYASKHKNIIYKEAVSPKEVMSYTCSADFGLSMIENTSLSYYYSLPNKLFEYTQAEIPVIVSDNIEMKNLVEKSSIGYSIKNETSQIVDLISKINKQDKTNFKDALIKFKNEFNWNKQELTLKEIYSFN